MHRTVTGTAREHRDSTPGVASARGLLNVVGESVILLCSLLSPQAVGQFSDVASNEFDWATYRTSPVDLIIESRGRFRHRAAGLNQLEREAYRELIREIGRRRQELRRESHHGVRGTWESAFYRYAAVRQRAWEKGRLEISGLFTGERHDPTDRTAAYDAFVTTQGYDLRSDIVSHPEAFTGRPVVLTGLLRKTAIVNLSDQTFDSNEGELIVTRGELSPMSAGFLSSSAENSTLMTTADSEGQVGKRLQTIAIVDTSSVHRTSGPVSGISRWPRDRDTVPVLVKGWVVKLWDHRPLIYCESVRELSANAPADLIRHFTTARRRLLSEESWLYYETLSALEVIPMASQREAAADFLFKRLEDLLREMAEKEEADRADLERRLNSGTLTEKQFVGETAVLQRLIERRIDRYHDVQQDPSTFDTYVDLFLNPDVWQGQPVTLRGHVRHTVSYPGDTTLFGGRTLHELWLFTDDSQHNPAVVVTPGLPDEFPVDADVIDKVSVTGCVFKEYVYNSQESRRIAPLILSGRVDWSPTDLDILAFADAGHLSTSSPLVRRATQARPVRSGGTVFLLVGFGTLLTLMILWGRAQRERQDRRNLLSRVNEPAEFESPAEAQYSPRLSDFTSGYDL